MVPALADKGIYVGSESTVYRVLHKHDMCHHRRKGAVPTHREVPTHSATAPNQAWMWDITYLPWAIKGAFFYLYLISDLISRFIVGWKIWPEETTEHFSELIRKVTLAGHIKFGDVLVLHSDNGSPMNGSTMLATMQSLGITPSFSRPRVSNDNAFAESLFSIRTKAGLALRRMALKALKPREWGSTFTRLYNNKYYYSRISYLSPAQRHTGVWRDVVEQRTAVYEAAKAAHPERWNGRNVRNWSAPEIVFLNPVKPDINPAAIPTGVQSQI